MNPQLEKLVALKNIDTEIAELQKGLEAIPKQVAAATAELESKKKDLNDTQNAIAEIKKKRQRLEQDVVSENDTMGKTKSKLTAVKTNKEYSALLAEIEAIKHKVTQIEDQQLELMEAMEAREKTLPGLKAQFAEEEARFKQYTAQKEQEKKRAEEELARAQAKRKEIAGGIEKRWVAHYDKVRKARGGESVVLLEGETCQGCFQAILPQLAIEIRQGKDVHECLHCNRILYTIPKPEAEATTTVPK